MSWEDQLSPLRRAYADRFSKEKEIEERYREPIKTAKDKDESARLKSERTKELEQDKQQKNEKVREQFENVLDMVDNYRTPCEVTAQQLTDYIKAYIPTYHFDCSEENLAKQKILHDRAKEALHHNALQLYRDDPYNRMGCRVWSEDRSELDYGRYIGMFMGEEYKKELEALDEMAAEGKKSEPEFIKRRDELHRQINLDAISKAEEKMAEYSRLTTEQMIDRYDEIYAFGRLGDTTNCSSPALSPKEQMVYHKTMNRFLSEMGNAQGKIAFLGSTMGEKADVEQLANLSMEERNIIMSGEGISTQTSPYLESTEDRPRDPLEELNFVTMQRVNKMLDQLEKNYPQFEIQYNPGKDLYVKGFQPKRLFQTTDGEIIDDSQVMTEMMQHHRPIYVSTENDPLAKPVLAYVDNDKVYSGAEAEKAFQNRQNAIQKKELAPYPPFEHKTKLGGFAKFWNGVCSAIERLPFVNSANALRTEAMIEYNDEVTTYQNKKAQYDKRLKEYEESNAKSREVAKEELTGDDKVNAIQKELFKKKPALKQKAADMEQKNRGIDLIVGKLADNVCAQNEGLQREDVIKTIKKGDTLSKMIADKDSLERYAKMAKEQPEALFAEYGQRLQQASKEDAKHASEPEKTLTQSKVLEKEQPAIEKEIQY